MPKKLRPQSRRQRRAVVPLTQARRAAHSYTSRRSKRNTNSCQSHSGCRSRRGRRRRRRHRQHQQNTVCRGASQQQAVDTSSTSYRTYKNSEELRSRIVSGIITPIHEHWDKASVSSPHREFPPATAREVDPLRIYPPHPRTSRQPPW